MEPDLDYLKETDHCEILGGRCPYGHPCSSCRLCREYEAAKDLSERLEGGRNDHG